MSRETSNLTIEILNKCQNPLRTYNNNERISLIFKVKLNKLSDLETIKSFGRCSLNQAQTQSSMRRQCHDLGLLLFKQIESS